LIQIKKFGVGGRYIVMIAGRPARRNAVFAARDAIVMKAIATDTGNAAASAAIERVLQAERNASEAVASCEREARAIVDEARQRAARIAERTTARISTARGRVAARVANAVKHYETEAAALQTTDQIDQEAHKKLEQAVAAVAAELTGEAP
jgi:vacuolar-type H+-ATPase subunit H